MIYHAWIRPGKKHSRVRVMLMIESAVQKPALIQTIDRCIDQQWNYGGGWVSLTCDRWEEDGEHRQEYVGAAHGSGMLSGLCS